MLPLVLRMLGAPWGEPVAEDFDFLHRALVQGTGTLLDGGGSQAFWRPIPHQLYYAAFGRLILGAPALVAVFHVAVMALSALLLYRALRRSWSGPLAAAAASFPVLAESTRTILSWPTQFVDLGLLLFTALALHEATRRRLARMLAALLAALLCKEVAVVTAVLLPFVPGAFRGRERWRAAGAVAITVATWGVATLWVRAHAHLELPGRIARSSQALAAPFAERLAWSLLGSVKALASLPLVASAHDGVALGLFAVAAVVALVLFSRERARARLAACRAWIGWGAAWFLLASAALTPIFPSWQPNRSQFGGVGFGIAAIGALGAAHPGCAAALVAGRLVMLALASGPVTDVRQDPPEQGAFMDYARLTRLQRFMRTTRSTLMRRFPTLPPGAIVVQENLPHGVEYAFGGDHALQVWYRDSSLHWMRFDAFRERPDSPVVAIVQGQPGLKPEMALVEPGAVRALLTAQALMPQERFAEVLAILDHGDSLQRDTSAFAYRVTSGAWRSYAWLRTNRVAEADSLSARLVPLAPTDLLLRQVRATARAMLGDFAAARAQLDTAESIAPGDPGTGWARERVNALRDGRARK